MLKCGSCQGQIHSCTLGTLIPIISGEVSTPACSTVRRHSGAVALVLEGSTQGP